MKHEFSWSWRCANWEKFRETLNASKEHLYTGLTEEGKNLEIVATNFQNLVIDTCKASMPIRRSKKVSKPWWSNEIWKLRCDVRKARRQFQRKRRDDRQIEYQNYVVKKKIYKKDITEAKMKSWDSFAKENSGYNPFSLPYEILVNKRTKSMIPTLLENTIIPSPTEEDVYDNLFGRYFPKDRRV